MSNYRKTTSKRKVGRPIDNGLRARRRDQILDQAVRIFAARGYSNTDLQVVADHIGVAKGTIYRYFPSKRALFLAAADWGMDKLHEKVQADTLHIADPLLKIAKGIYTYLTFFDKNPEVVELLVQERAEFKDRKKPTYFEHQKEGIKPWRELTENLIAQGRVKGSVEELLTVVDNLLYGTMFVNFFTGVKKSCKKQVREILNVVFYGVLSERERKRIITDTLVGQL